MYKPPVDVVDIASSEEDEEEEEEEEESENNLWNPNYFEDCVVATVGEWQTDGNVCEGEQVMNVEVAEEDEGPIVNVEVSKEVQIVNIEEGKEHKHQQTPLVSERQTSISESEKRGHENSHTSEKWQTTISESEETGYAFDHRKDKNMSDHDYLNQIKDSCMNNSRESVLSEVEKQVQHDLERCQKEMHNSSVESNDCQVQIPGEKVQTDWCDNIESVKESQEESTMSEVECEVDKELKKCSTETCKERHACKPEGDESQEESTLSEVECEVDKELKKCSTETCKDRHACKPEGDESQEESTMSEVEYKVDKELKKYRTETGKEEHVCQPECAELTEDSEHNESKESELSEVEKQVEEDLQMLRKTTQKDNEMKSDKCVEMLSSDEEKVCDSISQGDATVTLRDSNTDLSSISQSPVRKCKKFSWADSDSRIKKSDCNQKSSRASASSDIKPSGLGEKNASSDIKLSSCDKSASLGFSDKSPQKRPLPSVLERLSMGAGIYMGSVDMCETQSSVTKKSKHSSTENKSSALHSDYASSEKYPDIINLISPSSTSSGQLSPSYWLPGKRVSKYSWTDSVSKYAWTDSDSKWGKKSNSTPQKNLTLHKRRSHSSTRNSEDDVEIIESVSPARAKSRNKHDKLSLKKNRNGHSTKMVDLNAKKQHKVLNVPRRLELDPEAKARLRTVVNLALEQVSRKSSPHTTTEQFDNTSKKTTLDSNLGNSDLGIKIKSYASLKTGQQFPCDSPPNRTSDMEVKISKAITSKDTASEKSCSGIKIKSYLSLSTGQHVEVRQTSKEMEKVPVKSPLNKDGKKVGQTSREMVTVPVKSPLNKDRKKANNGQLVSAKPQGTRHQSVIVLSDSE